MRKIFTSILMLAACASIATANDIVTSKPTTETIKTAVPASHKVAMQATLASKPIVNAASETGTSVDLRYVPAAYYTETDLEGLANYYFCMTSVPSTYDTETGGIALDGAGWSIALDLYGASSSPMAIPAGTYTMTEDTNFLTCNPEYSSATRVNGDGTTDEAAVGSTIVVSTDDAGNTVIKLDVTLGSEVYNMTYTGKITFSDTNVGSNHTLPQIGRDIITDFTGAYGSYRGNLFESNTGNMVINLYDCEFNEATGSHTGIGYCVQLCLFNRLFGNPSKSEIVPGTYTMARNFAKNTYYPGIELTYLGNTLIIGCLAQYHDAAGNYSYSCIVDGTVVIEDAGDGNFTVTVDMVTDLGHVVRGSYTGAISIANDSSDTTKVSISNLTEDVELDMDQIDVARVYKQENAEGCSHFIIDIGSPSGKDESLANNGGDSFRFELLCNADDEIPQAGTYTLISNNWTTLYKPYVLIPGHFVDGGDLSGTRYFHYQEDHYLILDTLAPAVEGTVAIIDNGDDNFTFNIDVLDDAGFNITGTWTGDMEYTWDRSGVESVSADCSYRFADGILVVNGIDETAAVTVYAANGAALARGKGGAPIDLTALASGVYIVKVGAQAAFKIVK